MVKPFRAKISIWRSSTKGEELVDADILGPFAVHKAVDKGSYGGKPYVVTHIKTGLGILGARNRLHGLTMIRTILAYNLCWNVGSFGNAPPPWPDPGYNEYVRIIREAESKHLLPSDKKP